MTNNCVMLNCVNRDEKCSECNALSHFTDPYPCYKMCEDSTDVNISDKIADVYHDLINRGLNSNEALSIVLHLIDRGYFEK